VGSLSYDFDVKSRLKVLVVSAIPERFCFDSKPYRITNSTEGWAYALRGEFIGGQVPSLDTISRYDLVVANLDRALIPGLASVIRKRPGHVRWVSTIEGCGNDYLQPTPELLAVLDASDVISNINLHTTQYLQSLTKTPVHWIGVPYPAEDIRQFSTPIDLRRNDALICPKSLSEPSWKVAEMAGVDGFCFVPKVSRKLKNLPEFTRSRCFKKDVRLRALAKADRPIGVRGALEDELEQTWRTAGECRIWVNLDPRFTWARWVLDGAALGVPVISTASTAHSSLVFPELTVPDIFATADAAAMAKRLISNSEFYTEAIDKAWHALETFKPDAVVGRLEVALGERILER
jgi:hypothetical protein